MHRASDELLSANDQIGTVLGPRLEVGSPPVDPEDEVGKRLEKGAVLRVSGPQLDDHRVDCAHDCHPVVRLANTSPDRSPLCTKPRAED